ncbi:hypothetical protein KIN20_027793 [Parelaphostrongylus tenuis]|uniref:Uncharacterized protein n=1 Tax=Parelaphostrongylus tenuis TaxID=148309 RepID=A0AAD5R046_PARTN|nr:hypothetical protein KIN20_027793 [Parelaphostrongylus tenuis]
MSPVGPMVTPPSVVAQQKEKMPQVSGHSCQVNIISLSNICPFLHFVEAIIAISHSDYLRRVVFDQSSNVSTGCK